MPRTDVVFEAIGVLFLVVWHIHFCWSFHLTGCQVRRLELFGKKRILKKEGKGPFCEGPDQSGPFLLFWQQR